MPHVRSAALASVAVMSWLALSSSAARALTPLTALRYASDITIVLGGTTITPAGVAEDDLGGMVMAVDVGNLPADAQVDAYHRAPNGEQLLSFDTTVMLPGGVTAGPADVVRFTGQTYIVVFDAAANDVPEGVNVDAVALSGGDLLLSFDTAVGFDGLTVEDEDLVRFDGSVPEFVAFFTGGTAGVSADLDLDGAQVIGPQLLLSFDGSGTLEGVNFNDDDVLEYGGSPGTWELAYQGSAQHEGWEAGDLVGLFALVAGMASPTPTPTPTSPGGTLTPTPVISATSTPTGTLPTSTPTPTGTLPTLTPTPVVTGTPGGCVGDCDGNGTVTVDELIRMVNIALDNLPVSQCLPGDPSGDGEIAIDELITAVNNALNGC